MSAFKAYQYHGTVESGEEAREVLDRLSFSMNGGVFQSSTGLMTMRAGKYRDAAITLEESDWLSVDQCTPWPSLATRSNSITALIEQSERNQYENDTVVRKDAAAIARDGRERPIEINFENQKNPLQVGWLLNVMTLEDRESFWITGTVKPQPGMSQMELLPGDVIFQTALAEYGVTNRRFVVKRVVKDSQFRDGRYRKARRIQPLLPVVAAGRNPASADWLRSVPTTRRRISRRTLSRAGKWPTDFGIVD